MIKCGIYRIRNTINNKIYIGSSKDIQKRWKRHLYDLSRGQHHCMYLQRAWDKYGKDSFVIEPIKRCHEKSLFRYEQELLDENFGKHEVYNTSPHAVGGDIISAHPKNQKIRQKISVSVKKNIDNMTLEERKKKWGKSGKDNPNHGNRWSAEKRKAASERMKKRFRLPEEKQKISEARKRYFSNPSNRKKMSDFAKTRTGSKNAFYGKSHSNESKEKMRQTKLGKYNGNQERPVEIDNVMYKSVSEAARQRSVCPATIIHRIRSANKKFTGYRYL